jgi:hypothetical protein
MHRQNLSRWLLVAVAAAIAGHPGTTQASLPVPYAIVGCIEGGSFRSQGFAGRSLVSAELKALEGKTIRIEGLLSPGDAFVASALYIVHEQCRAYLHRRYFLCSPCQTIMGAPPSKMLPRDDDSTKIEMSPAAIKEFDNYARVMRR